MLSMNFILNASELLKCNTEKIDVFERLGYMNILGELSAYFKSIEKDRNYGGFKTLEEWKPEREKIPFFAGKITNLLKIIKPVSICEAGAGAGIVSRYVGEALPNSSLTCIEANNFHVQHLKQHLSNHKIKADIVHSAIQDISSVKDNSFDFVYTSEVLMHIPFIPAVLAACELARITNKYILHAENISPCVNIGDMKYKKENIIGLVYPKIYEKLGFETIHLDMGSYPGNSKFTYIVYLGKKRMKKTS